MNKKKKVPGADHIVFYKNGESIFYSRLSNGFYFVLWLSSAWGVLKLIENAQF